MNKNYCECGVEIDLRAGHCRKCYVAKNVKGIKKLKKRIFRKSDYPSENWEIVKECVQLINEYRMAVKEGLI